MTTESRVKGRVVAALMGIFLSAAVFAEERPKIGVVLGGGGALGMAHVGVLRVLLWGAGAVAQEMHQRICTGGNQRGGPIAVADVLGERARDLVG